MYRAVQFLTRADKVLILAAALATLILALRARWQAEPGGQVIVEVNGRIEGHYDLAVHRQLAIAGPLGQAQVEIGAEGVRMVQAPCINQVCVRRGWARHRGEVVVCIPNRLILRIGGRALGENVDAVLR
jgi:hypothetical protein